MTFEQLQEANAGIKMSLIKGSAYAGVPERVKAFRKLYPDGFIRTNTTIDGKICIVHAVVGYYDNGAERILAEGTAREVEGSSFVNDGSHVENAETSAVGRAIGFIGLLGGDSVASYEEMANALANKPCISLDQVNEIVDLAGRDNVPLEYIRTLYKVRAIKELTPAKYDNIITHWDKIKEGATK